MSFSLNTTELESDAPLCDGRLREFLETTERRRPQLLRMARRLTQCHEDAEDILQESFMKAFKALARFRGESQMSSWLGAIVQNTAHEHLRSRRKRVFVSIEYLSKKDNEFVEIDLPDPSRNPEETWGGKEMENIVHEEVSKLSHVCRRAVEMCVLEEHQQLAAARTLNLSVATMKSRVFRGKRILGRAVSRRLATRRGGIAGTRAHSVGREA